MTQPTGCLFIISAPSGAGKTSLVKALLQLNLNLSLSISHTTRSPRSDEINGRDYHFVSRDAFQQMLVNEEFLEHAEVYGNLYGTSQQWINKIVASGQDILLEIDCQGARQVRQIFPQSIGIFILPPSVEALASRLKTRAQDKSDVIQKRLAAAREEISHVCEFEYVIINNKLEHALEEVTYVIKAERLKKDRQLIKHHSLIAQLS
jgi:guanylate kinase